MKTRKILAFLVSTSMTFNVLISSSADIVSADELDDVTLQEVPEDLEEPDSATEETESIIEETEAAEEAESVPDETEFTEEVTEEIPEEIAREMWSRLPETFREILREMRGRFGGFVDFFAKGKE